MKYTLKHLGHQSLSREQLDLDQTTKEMINSTSREDIDPNYLSKNPSSTDIV